MKVLRVNVVYNRGSTGKTVADLHHMSQKSGYESIVCYGRQPQPEEHNVYKISSELEGKLNVLWNRITGIPYSGAYLATARLIKLILTEKPNVVHLHCINGHFVNIARLLHFLKDNNIPTVLTLHAEFMYTGGCGHAFECEKWKTGCGRCPRLWDATHAYFFDRTHTTWQRLADAFIGFNHLIITAVSPWLAERARQSPFLKDKRIIVVENGIDTDQVFRPASFSDLRDKHQLANEKIVLHVTANFSAEYGHPKGGWFVIALAERLIDLKLKFLIVGARDTQRSLPANMINVGRIEDQHALAAYYSLANLTVITSKRETFSKVCAESLACGTPVVGFKAGGPEIITLNEYSEFVDFGELDALEIAVRNWITKKQNIQHELREKAREHYSREKMSDAYTKIYNMLIDRE